MSEYPSYADLAAFRRRITPRVQPAAFIVPGGALSSPKRGAWRHERKDGIGTAEYVIVTDQWGRSLHHVPTMAAVARREANGLRHEAYERIVTEAAGDAGLAIDLEAAVIRFAGTYRQYHTGHGGAAGSFWPDCPLCPIG